MGDELTTHHIDDIFEQLREIKGEIRENSKRLHGIERNQAVHQRTLEAAVERQSEDRARITITEDNVEELCNRMGRAEERQKLGAALLGGIQLALAAIMALIGARTTG